MTAPDTRAELRKAIEALIAEDQAGGWQESLPSELADRIVALPELRARESGAEERGYERGRRDFQFQPSGDNHHNAALCPYCSPKAESLARERAAEAHVTQLDEWVDGNGNR